MKNNFKTVNISVNDMDEFEKKKSQQRREHVQNILSMIGTIG